MSQIRPTIGVCIPAYNQARYVRECVESVINQTYPPSQIVICDDASTDGTREIVQEYEKKYLGLVEAIYQPRNVGVSANINAGLRSVKQSYTSVIATDDVWRTDKLQLEVESLQSAPEARWAYSGIGLIDEEGKFLRLWAKEDTGREGNVLFSVLAHRIRIRNQLVESSLVRDVGYEDEQFQLWEDWDRTIRLSARAPIVWVPQTTAYYRKHRESLSQSSPTMALFRNLRKIYEKHEALIASLPPDQQAEIGVQRRARYSSHLVMGIQKEISGELGRRRRLKALGYWLVALVQCRRVHAKWLAKILLPTSLVARLRSVKS